MRGAMLTFLRYGGAMILRLGTNLVLTRLLFAEVFGLMALVSVLVQGVQMFSDVGIGPSIIRSKRANDPVFLDTLWTVQVVRGFGQWLVMGLLAWPFAKFYGDPQLLQMVPVIGLSAVILGFGSTKQYTQNRELRLGGLMIMELAAQAAGAAMMITLAYFMQSVWALVFGTLFNNLVRTALSFLILPGPNNRLRWEPEARAELFGFGRW